MATKQARGTKRTCQNSDCGSRFYDLNREPIMCPLCQSAYVIASAPMLAEVASEPPKANAEFADAGAVAPGDAPEAEVEALADIEPAEEAAAGAEDETFLEEEEEDGGDVSGILGVGGEDEEEA
jgi:uncharacterized protein (TIGR02300 family)